MSTAASLGMAKTQLAASSDRTEVLRQIISRQENREVSYREAQELAYRLLRFYEVLGEDEQDVRK